VGLFQNTEREKKKKFTSQEFYAQQNHPLKVKTKAEASG
jgi:hypothetical protein